MSEKTSSGQNLGLAGMLAANYLGNKNLPETCIVHIATARKIPIIRYMHMYTVFYALE